MSSAMGLRQDITLTNKIKWVHHKDMKIKVALLLSFFLLCASFSPAFALQKGVLGVSTDHLALPPTVEGPGFLLPDSPFYALDGFKQQVRLFFAFTPQMKAQVYASIAGERLAELRFELAKNNPQAAEIALAGVRENTKQAALSLDNARLLGNNVEDTAADINRQIKEHLLSLDTLSLQASGEMKADVMYTTQTLADAKAVVEDGMRKDLIATEVKDDITREVALKLLDTTSTAQELKADLDELQKEATSDAQKALTNRKDAINSVIAQDKDALTQKATELQKTQLQQQADDYVSNIVASAQKAAAAFQKSQSLK